MKFISKALEYSIEHMDTAALDQHLVREDDLEQNHYQLTLFGYRKRLISAFKSIKGAGTTRPTSNHLNDQEILRWWEVTSPDFQSN